MHVFLTKMSKMTGSTGVNFYLSNGNGNGKFLLKTYYVKEGLYSSLTVVKS